MTDQTPTPSADEGLRRFREYVTASIALIIIAGTIIMIIIAMLTTGNADQTQIMKDLLLLVLPLTGTVLGYYLPKPAPRRTPKMSNKPPRRLPALPNRRPRPSKLPDPGDPGAASRPGADPKIGKRRCSHERDGQPAG